MSKLWASCAVAALLGAITLSALGEEPAQVYIGCCIDGVVDTQISEPDHCNQRGGIWGPYLATGDTFTCMGTFD